VRALFLLLVLANVAFFAWARFVAGGGSGADPAPLSRQIAPEKIRVVPPEELARLSSSKPAPTPTPAPVSVAPAPKLKCLEWGSFSPADAVRAGKALEPLALGERLAERRTEETAGWWVYIPPPNGHARRGALRKAGELKKLGVQDFFVVQEEGANRWAISLGVFRSEEAAQSRLSALRGQGVRTARVGPRESHVQKVWLQIKDADAALETRLQSLARQFEGSELRDCVP